MDEQPIINLDGYLLALRRLSGDRCDFWAEVFDSKNSVEDDFRTHVSNRNIELLDSLPVGYKEIDKALWEHSLSKLNIKNESLLKLFAWDIVEYIQMSYRLIDSEIEPISSAKALLINAESKFHGRYVYVVIPVQNKGVAVGLATRA